MSLVSFALRLIGARVVRGQTWAGSRIYNSPVDPVAEWQTGAQPGESQPCMAIYSGKRETEVVGKATQGTGSDIEVVFNLFVPPTVIVAQPAEGTEPEIRLETSNTGAAMVLDLMARQLDIAFRFGPPTWRALWDKFVVKVEGVRSRPLLYEIDRTVQIPCLEVTYSLKAIPDPDFGIALPPYWQLLRDAMLADADYAASAPLLDALISAPEGLPNWRQVQAAMGFSDAAIRATGLAPMSPTEPDEPSVVTDIDLVQGPISP